jgi:hypothetical protein
MLADQMLSRIYVFLDSYCTLHVYNLYIFNK